MRKMQFSASSHDKFIPLVYGVYMDHVNRFSSPFIAVKAGSSAPQLNPSANAVKAGSSAPQLNPSANGLFRMFATSSQVRLGYRFILLFVLHIGAILYLPVQPICHSLPFHIVLARISNSILNNIGESGYPCPVPSCRG